VVANGYLYVAHVANNTVSVISTADNTLTLSIPVGQGPSGIAASLDGSRVYVANAVDGTVSVVDTGQNQVTDTINVGNTPLGVAVSPDGLFVYVTNAGDDTVSVLSASGDALAVADTIAVGDWPLGVTVTPDGAYLYVANSFDDSVSVIQTSDHTVLIPPIPVGVGPIGVAAGPDGKVFVSHFVDGTLAVIATADHTVADTIAAGNGPRGIGLCAGPSEPVIEKLKPRKCDLGKVIKIIGNHFGDLQGDSVVLLGNHAFDATSPAIKLWTNTKIRLKVPLYECAWFGSENLKSKKVRVTVYAADSNKKRLKILKPAACACQCDLNGDGFCDNQDLDTFSADWSQVGCQNGTELEPCECDLNGDGVCDGADWDLFYQDWQRAECQ
jgi:YVTN family beta-propeller protein